MSLYAAGFPCTPFSTLGSLERLRDPNAKQFYACIKRIKSNKPKAPLSNGQVRFVREWFHHDNCCSLFLCFFPHWPGGSCQPKVAVLENVMGFMAVAEKAARFIRRNCPEYFGWMFPLKPCRIMEGPCGFSVCFSLLLGTGCCM